MNDYNNVLVGFSELIKNEEFRPYEGDLRLGVDLGTANIVVSVVDSNNTPIAGASYPSTVVRDGIVVDFMGASRAVRNMKAKLEDLMGVEFYEAASHSAGNYFWKRKGNFQRSRVCWTGCSQCH